MRKIFLFVLVSLISITSFGQAEDIEPNNSFETAGVISKYNGSYDFYGRLDKTDTSDFYSWDRTSIVGSIKMNIGLNNLSNKTAHFTLNVYDGRKDGGLIFTKVVEIAAGRYEYPLIEICNPPGDLYYFNFKCDENISYSVNFNNFIFETTEGNANNDTRPNAKEIAGLNTLEKGVVGYVYQGVLDTIDFYKSTMTTGRLADRNLRIRTWGIACTPATATTNYDLYKNNESTPFASGSISNDEYSPYNTIDIPLSNLQVGDVVSIKLAGHDAVYYEMKIYDKEDNNDKEPNDEIENAVPTIPNTTYKGNVGKNNDRYDSYRFIMPFAGAADFAFQASNDDCATKSYFNYYLVDKEGNDISYAQSIFFWDTDSPCDNVQTMHIKMRGLNADTFYIRLFAFENMGSSRGVAPPTHPVTYNFSYQFVDQANEDPEPNNELNQAIPVAPGEVRKGRLRFYAPYPANDYIDYYSLNIPSAGSIDLIIKSTYRGSEELYNQYDKLLSIQAENTSFLNFKTPGYPEVKYVQPDSSYSDTIRICGVGAGPLPINLQGATGEYEFHFEMTDVVTGITEVEPNNNNKQAQLFRDSSMIKATVNYFENGIFDEEDNFKIHLYENGPITLYVKATNTKCNVNSGNTYLRFTGTGNGGSEIFNKIIANKYQVPFGETIYDTIQFSRQMSDTLFLNVTSAQKTSYKYEFFTSLFRPRSDFEIKGDSTVCLGEQKYIAGNIQGENLIYHWSLPLGGGTITWVDSIATVTWNQAGTFPVELYLSNTAGNSITNKLNIIVNNEQPTIAPEIFNFARNLSTSPLPPGTTVQWYRNETPVNDAIDSVYYAGLGGNYTARFINDCGPGPISNPYNFSADAVTQSINYPHVTDMQMAPQLKIKLRATSSSGLPVYYSVINGLGAISNDSLVISGVGKIVIKAEQPGNDEFRPAGAQFDTITVTKGNQVITFKPIPGQWYRKGNIQPGATSSIGQNISYTIVSGNASGGDKVDIKGVGNITVQANQEGNTNYNAAPPVQQTFCVGIDTLSTIKGSGTACLGTYTYTTEKITGANYVWTLSGGGTIITNNDTAFVSWNTTGNHTLNVKANSECNSFYGSASELSIKVEEVTPEPVINMLPANGAVGQSLPLVLSWVPGKYTETYDLFVWDSAVSRPSTPYQKNIAGISFTIPQNAFAYDKTYKWQLIPKNPCHENAGGPIHTFRLVPLPDLIVTNVLAPTSATSGQVISITWTVKNDGPGATLATQNWQDNVYFSFDSILNLTRPPKLSAAGWNSLDLPARPLLINSKTNVRALQPGEQYTNTINFKLPVDYSFPVYVFVGTNGNKSILEAAIDNNTTGAGKPISITLAPTPDLRVDSVFNSNIVFSGATISVTYKVKNYGTLTPAGAKWNDQVYLSRSLLFDSTTAIKLNGPNGRSTYYPDMPKAFINVNTQLEEGKEYTRSISTIIPNFIFGQWFIHVKTNDNYGLYEGPSMDNNTSSNPIQIYLTPTPHLTVNSISLPVSEASTTQPIGINWVIKNTGFTDNFEKNHGYYYTISTGLNCPWTGPPLPPGTKYKGLPIYKDSLAEGSSYWLDRIYISSDPTGLDISNATLLHEFKNGIPNAGLSFWQRAYACGTHGIFNTTHALWPNRSFNNSTGFNVPQGLAPGTYYIYVYTNPTKTVFEYPGKPEIKRSSAIVIQRPDVVASMNTQASAVAGTPMQISYQVSNNGPGNVFNHFRQDSIYISYKSTFDESATLVATKSYTENIFMGSPVTHSIPFTLHPSQSGIRYFFVKTNATRSFAETDFSNNLSDAAAVVFAEAAPVDLIVKEVLVPDTVFGGRYASLQYTITNNGLGAATGYSVDSFFISCNSVFSSTTAYYIGMINKNRDIAPGASLTDTFSTTLPLTFELGDCFPNDEFNNAYFFVKTNATDSIYEGLNSTNNTTSSSKKVIKNMLVDLQVSNVRAGLTALVGRPYSIIWKIENVGEAPYRNLACLDSVYLSVDSVFNSDAIPFGSLEWVKYPYVNEAHDRTIYKNFINVPSGNYYVHVKTNTGTPPKMWLEKNFSNNINMLRNEKGKAQTISVVRPPLPDLVDSILSYPTTASPGQPITLIHRVKNIGEGASYPYEFKIRVSLADDQQGDKELYNLSHKSKIATIQPGDFVDDSISVYLPSSVIPRNYSLVVKVDYDKNVVETNELNNYASVYVNVFKPDPVDFIITSLEAIDTVLLGYQLDSVRYTVKNNSANPAYGFTSDGFYLSASNVIDSSAVLVGIKEKRIYMSPLASETLGYKPMITGVTEGSYNLFVNTDLTNSIPETNETNNTAMAPIPVYVKVKELHLGELESNTLDTSVRFYKLIIPDSLNGATISVKLVSNDSLVGINQLFIGKDYIPDAAHFDYTYTTANYGNQDVIMDYTTAGTYYISFRSINTRSWTQNITLMARKLPFEISSIQSTTGGNIGNVTVKINGALFTEGMKARLNKSGTEIIASTIYFTNTTTVYATFNLQGKPLGIYNLTLSKGDTSFAVLSNGFSIVTADNGGLITGSGPNTGAGDGTEPGCDPGAASGLNSQLVTELIVPDQVFMGWPFVIQINFKNPTNFDIPAQVRTVFAEDIVKLGLTAESSKTGSHSMTFEMTETDGPPGVLRAGGSGTIIIYGRSIENVISNYSLINLK